MDEDLKITDNDNASSNNTSINTLTNYFLSSPNIAVDKRKSIELMQKIHMCLIMCLMAFGALKAHFHSSPNLIASPIKCHRDM